MHLKDSKSGFAPIVVLLIVAILLCGAYFAVKSGKPNLSQKTTISVSPEPTKQAEVSPTPLPYNNPKCKDNQVPEDGVLYIATYQSKDVFFITTPSIQKPDDFTSKQSGRCTGEVVGIPKNSSIEFTQLSSPRKIALAFLPNGNFEPLWFIKNSDGKKFYLSMIIEGPGYDRDENNMVYEIDMNNLTGTEIYKGAAAVLFNKLVDDKYLLIGKTYCWNCDGNSNPHPPSSTTIVNVVTHASKYLGLVGKVEVKDGTVSYQQLVHSKVLCTEAEINTAIKHEGQGSPDCGKETDGKYYKSVYKPSGEIITEPLP